MLERLICISLSLWSLTLHPISRDEIQVIQCSQGKTTSTCLYTGEVSFNVWPKLQLIHFKIPVLTLLRAWKRMGNHIEAKREEIAAYVNNASFELYIYRLFLSTKGPHELQYIRHRFLHSS